MENFPPMVIWMARVGGASSWASSWISEQDEIQGIEQAKSWISSIKWKLFILKYISIYDWIFTPNCCGWQCSNFSLTITTPLITIQHLYKTTIRTRNCFILYIFITLFVIFYIYIISIVMLECISLYIIYLKLC